MKEKAKIVGADPSPFDTVEYVEKGEFDFAHSEMKFDRELLHGRIDKIEQKIRERTIIGGLIAAALVFVMIMRKDE